MKKHISYPSTNVFRNIVSNVNREYAFVGLDDNGDAIYDHSKPKPILRFKGTIKLHGTNAGVSYNKKNGIWAQSREILLHPKATMLVLHFLLSVKKIFLYH